MSNCTTTTINGDLRDPTADRAGITVRVPEGMASRFLDGNTYPLRGNLGTAVRDAVVRILLTVTNVEEEQSYPEQEQLLLSISEKVQWKDVLRQLSTKLAKGGHPRIILFCGDSCIVHSDVLAGFRQRCRQLSLGETLGEPCRRVGHRPGFNGR